MKNINTTKARSIAVVLATSLFIIGTQSIGQIFFINRTESMPRGIYAKNVQDSIEIGDAIVFYENEFEGNLIKYVAAISPSEVCFGEEGSLWVDGFPVAQINIEKYPAKVQTESQCQRLKQLTTFVVPF